MFSRMRDAMNHLPSDKVHWHSLDVKSVLSSLGSDPRSGLTTAEASSRRVAYGPNAFRAEQKISPLKILLKQFQNLLIGILLVATVISAFLGQVFEAVAIFVIVFFAVLLGFAQEFSAERSLASLKRMLKPECTVLRDAKRTQIPTEDLVPGDVLLLDNGETVDGDARIIEAFNLKINEASLTGESGPIEKSIGVVNDDAPIAEQANMSFAGTTVVYGRGKAVVVSTGLHTQFGKIVEAVASIEIEETPLERQMDEIGRKLGRITLLLVAAIAVGALIETYSRGDMIGIDYVVDLFTFAVALAVAAVPEALPAIVTGSLAIGTRVMAKRNAIVRNLPAVETLGSTQVICTDKTGTLTKGEMTVREVCVADSRFEVTGTGYEPKGELVAKAGSNGAKAREVLHELSKAVVLCSDAVLDLEDEKWIVIGDATEGALVAFSEKMGVATSELRRIFPRVGELPFSSERKRLTTIHLDHHEKAVAYTKGAPERILAFCDSIRKEEIVQLTQEEKTVVLKLSDQMAQNALRVLAIAEKPLDVVPEQYSEDTIETGFTLLGLVGINDPPRPDAIEAVKAAKRVGMKSVMITGDHKLTALAIARETGIYDDEDTAITGEELEKLSERDLEESVEKISVYARVSPIHKMRIVNAWQKKGKVVAMTGDGVNDAPALKKADIGVAMGLTGSDVAKDAADLILADDNFATIVEAIELGRWIYDNIKKYLAYVLQTNFVEIAVMTLAALIVLPWRGLFGENVIPLLAVQILYINLATDGLPAIALGFSPPDPDLMSRLPRPRNEPVFTRDVTRLIVMALLVQMPLLILGFASGLNGGLLAARSRLFLMFVAMELGIALNCRSLSRSLLEVRPHKWLLLTVIWECVLIIVLMIIPSTRAALGMVQPSTIDLAWIIGAAVVATISIELLKGFWKLRPMPAQS